MINFKKNTIHRTNIYPSENMKQRSVHFVQGINLRKGNQQIIIKMNHQKGRCNGKCN